MLAWQTQEFLKLEIARDKYTVYLDPKIVAEIAFNEIQVSPRYAMDLHCALHASNATVRTSQRVTPNVSNRTEAGRLRQLNLLQTWPQLLR